jgi:predicted nucleic acid-binding protein
LIVVDSSVWIDFFNGRSTPQTLRLMELLGNEPLLVGDLMLCELLQGARSEANARELEKELRRFEIVNMLNESLAIEAARNYRRLREKGCTVRKTVDLLIGTYCIENKCELLHADRDFEPMERHLKLRTVATQWAVHEARR